MQVLPDALCVLLTDPKRKGLEVVSDNQGNVSFTASLSQRDVVSRPTLSCSNARGNVVRYPLELRGAEGVPPLRARAPQGVVRPPLSHPELDRTEDELRAGGYPRRPDPVKSPNDYKEWVDFVSKPGTIINQNVGLAPSPHRWGATQELENWTGFESFKGSNPLLEVYAKWQAPSQTDFPEQVTNQDFNGAVWVGLGDGNSGGPMWQSGTNAGGYSEPNGSGGYNIYAANSFWMELIGGNGNFCPGIPFYPAPNADDSVSSWMWFSANSSCSGVGITGNNDTQYLALQITDYTQSLTYNWCKPVTWFLNQGNCSSSPMTGGSAEWILERVYLGWDGRGPSNCTNLNFLPSLLSTDPLLLQVEAYDTGWHWFDQFSNTNQYTMIDNESQGFCDADTGYGLAQASDETSEYGEGAIQIDFFSNE